MNTEINIWQLAAGLGLFLFGMYQLEESVRRLAGRSFKLFLRSNTESPVRGAISGVIATATLQSSSVVGLIVLAFAGSGIITLANALGGPVPMKPFRI